MAFFAEIDSNNRVLRIVVADQQDINNNGGDQSEQAAEFFKKIVPLSELGIKWVQAFDNGNRKKYPATGDIFNINKNKFISPQPYQSWILDQNDDWQAPIEKPITYTKEYSDQSKIFLIYMFGMKILYLGISYNIIFY